MTSGKEFNFRKEIVSGAIGFLLMLAVGITVTVVSTIKVDRLVWVSLKNTLECAAYIDNRTKKIYGCPIDIQMN